jgi:antitoxin component of MazEF toxin-antitoxin module
MTVTVKKVGGSVAVLLPKAVAREMELLAGTALDLSTSGGAIVMRKSPARRPRRSIEKIVAEINPASYRRRNREHSDRGPVGQEVW